MISVSFSYDKEGVCTAFSCSGHAGYADSGSDIVCAAVSMLVINTINALSELTDNRLTASSDDERGIISCRFDEGLDEEGRLLVDAMRLGLISARDEYGERYIKISERR